MEEVITAHLCARNDLIENNHSMMRGRVDNGWSDVLGEKKRAPEHRGREYQRALGYRREAQLWARRDLRGWEDRPPLWMAQLDFAGS